MRRRQTKEAPMRGSAAALTIIAAACAAAPASAQRTGENAVTAASDGFGTSVGNEQNGLYSSDEVRGFSPGGAGNNRIDGLFLWGLVIGKPRLPPGTSGEGWGH